MVKWGHEAKIAFEFPILDQIFLIRYPDLSEKIQVSRNGGTMPRWNASGNRIYYLSENKMMHSAEITRDGERLQIGDTEQLFTTKMRSTRTHQYAISPDADRFYILEPTDVVTQNSLELLVNWIPAR
jgi:hypothetical protein